jgi:pantoate--beta-alanine ligase
VKPTSERASHEWPPIILLTIENLRMQVRKWRTEGGTIALIPTMGALHEGHLSLVKTGKRNCDRTIISIFVNPTQFGPGEDFNQYPRNQSADIAAARAVDADAVYIPSVQEMYGSGNTGFYSTSISVSGLSDPMEGAIRPNHFDGVALVVCKLLLQCQPDVAVFGEKDYQQLQIIKRLVTDLNIPVNIVSSPLVRQPDGVAMSSRNAYLTESQKSIAPGLRKTLLSIARKLQSDPDRVETILRQGIQDLSKCGFNAVDYLELRDSDTLVPLSTLRNNYGRLLAAARLGKVRLLDNIEISA